MPNITIAGKEYEILPPRRKIYVHEVGQHFDGDLWLRVRAALVALSCPTVFAGQPPIPPYTGKVGTFGEEIFDRLIDAGATGKEIAEAGYAVWLHWVATLKAPTKEAVEAEENFTRPNVAPRSDGTASSS